MQQQPEKAISSLYETYAREVQQFKSRSANTYIREEDAARTREFLLDQFRRESAALCPNEAELCDILIDLCYCDNRSKQFVWDLCGHVILRNLLQKMVVSSIIRLRMQRERSYIAAGASP